MNLSTLRDETREQHEAVEATLPLTAPGLDREHYGEILQGFQSVFQGWDTWAAEHAPTRLGAMVRARRRSPLLLRDLQFFGLAPLPGRGNTPQALDTLLDGRQQGSPDYEAAFLGAMYVMEGSTLGGQYIARHVEDVLGLVPGQGDAFFRGYGEETGAMWNAFRQVLAAVPDEYAAVVIHSAKVAFAYFGDTMHCCFPAVAAPHALS